MENCDKPSMFVRCIGPLVLIMLALGGLTVFGFEAIGTAQQLFSDPDVVRLNKGVFYMFGAGIVLVVLSFVLMYEFWYGNPLTANLTVACTRICLTAVVVTFLLPHIVHYSMDYYLKNKGYEICDQASHQWRRFRTIVYVRDMGICLELSQEEK